MQRGFKGIWIPKELWLLKDLSLLEKVMIIAIDSLNNEDGCFATNDYFANFFDLSKNRISKIINRLVKRGYVTSEIKYKDGTQTLEKRVLKVSFNPYIQNSPEIVSENTSENKLNSSLQALNKSKPCDTHKKFDADSDPYLLAQFLEKRITDNSPKFPQSETQRQRWAKDFDFMIRIDKISPNDIAKVIDWCQGDTFWKSNILSGKKLREKYQQLRIKMDR